MDQPGDSPWSEIYDIMSAAWSVTRAEAKQRIIKFRQADTKPPVSDGFPLPPECEPYRHDIRRFMDAMVYKIKKNAHKGRWSDMTSGQALDRLHEEVRELIEAMQVGNRLEIEMEAADVANFALILTSIIHERGK